MNRPRLFGMLLAGLTLIAVGRAQSPALDERAAFGVLQTGHSGGIAHLAFSPDGTMLVTGGEKDGQVLLWDVQTGYQVRGLPGHTGSIDSLSFDQGGKTLVTSAHDWTVSTWDWRTGRRTGGMPESHQFTNVHHSPDGATYLAFGQRNTFKDFAIRLYDSKTDQKIRDMEGHEDTVLMAAYSPDGRRVASSSGDHTLVFWNLDQAAPVRITRIWAKGERGQTMRDALARTAGRGFNTTARPGALAFSPDGRALVSSWVPWLADDYGELDIRLWDGMSGAPIRPLAGHTRPVYALGFSPDGKLLASGDAEGTVKLWDTRRWKVIKTWRAHGQAVSDLAFSPDGQLLATSSLDGTAILWVVDGWFPLRTLKGRLRSDTQVRFASGGRFLSSDPEAGTTTCWDATEARRLITLPGRLEGAGPRLALSPDGTRIADLMGDTLQVRDVALGRVLWKAQLKAWPTPGFWGDDPPRAVQFSPNGALLATAEAGGIQVWEVATGASRTPLPEAPKEVRLLRFNADGSRLVAAGGWTVALWDLASTRRIWTAEVIRDPKEPLLPRTSVNALEFSSDSASVIAVTPRRAAVLRASDGGLMTALDPPDKPFEPPPPGQEVTKLQYKSFAGIAIHNDIGGPSLNRVAISPDAKALASGDGATVVLWDLTAQRPPLLLKGHKHLVRDLAFSPDGKNLVSAAQESEARVWEVATGKALGSMYAMKSRHMALAFSPDGGTLASVEEHIGVTLYRSPTRVATATFIGLEGEEYIVITPNQHYTATKAAARGMAFRVGQRMVPFAQFDLQRNRPDLVLEEIGATPPDLLKLYQNLVKRRLLQQTGNPGFSFMEGLAFDSFGGKDHGFNISPRPSLAFSLAPPLLVRTPDLKLSLKAASDGRLVLKRGAKAKRVPLRAIHVQVNDVPIFGSRGKALGDGDPETWVGDIAFRLTPGLNRIWVSVGDALGRESLRRRFDVIFQGPPAQPNLYALLVGISKYHQPKLNLTYAAKDAEDLAQALGRNGPPFKEVKLLRIYDRQATRKAILEAKPFLAQAREEDMVILFLAGHGFLDPQAQYHFATTEMDTKLPGDQGLAFPEIEALLDGLASRHKLVLMDTCHAGEVEPPDNLAAGGGNTPAGRVVARATEAMRALPEEGGSQFRSGKNLGLVQHLFSDLRAGSGAAVIGSASGNEFAFESPAWRNGVFTFAMLQALKNPGTDRDQDGRITVTELRDYVTEAVLRLTQGRQTPTTRKELMDLDDTLRVLPKQGAKRQSRKAEPK